MRTHVDNLPEGDLKPKDVADLAFALQLKTANILAYRCENAIQLFLTEYEGKTLVICGGVSANKTICKELEKLTSKYNMNISYPPLSLSGDNGAMIAWAGIERLQNDQNDPMDYKAKPRWPLDPTAAPIHNTGKKGKKA